jgi:hypothetical protein
MASRHRFIVPLLYVCLAIARCGGGGGSTTPTPTPSTPTVTSVAVSGAGAPVVGDTVQLAATATLSDGTTQVVTGQATWESSNQAVATVTAAGVATFLAQGDADLKATYKSVSGTARVSVAAKSSPKYTLTGTVSDATNGNPLPGVNATILEGVDKGRSGVTGADGRYSIASVSAGTFLVQFTRSDYETRSVGVTVNADTSLDVKITANQASVTRFYGTYNTALTIQQQGCSFPFTVGPTGTLKLEGNTSGSSLTATIVERGTTRRYAGSIRTDGSFSGVNLDTVIAGFTPPRNKHSYSGSLSGTATGSRIDATEAITFGDPCPGATMKIAYSGSK